MFFPVNLVKLKYTKITKGHLQICNDHVTTKYSSYVIKMYNQ